MTGPGWSKFFEALPETTYPIQKNRAIVAKTDYNPPQKPLTTKDNLE